eukprot:10219866-Alexandrium_andersonii.AAC.1
MRHVLRGVRIRRRKYGLRGSEVAKSRVRDPPSAILQSTIRATIGYWRARAQKLGQARPNITTRPPGTPPGDSSWRGPEGSPWCAIPLPPSCLPSPPQVQQ